MNARELMKYVGKSGTWIIEHAGDNREAVRLPVTIINAKVAFGSVRLEVVYSKEQRPIWVKADQVQVNWHEIPPANNQAWGSQYRD